MLSTWADIWVLQSALGVKPLKTTVFEMHLQSVR